MARFIKSMNQQSTDEPGASAQIFMSASSEQKQKQGGGGEESSDGENSGSQKSAKKGEGIKEDLDSLMDEIDAVLEENAEEFVKNYVQRGGE